MKIQAMFIYFFNPQTVHFCIHLLLNLVLIYFNVSLAIISLVHVKNCSISQTTAAKLAQFLHCDSG